MYSYTVVVQSSIQLQQNETGTNIYIFNRRHQSTCCLTFLSWHALSIITVFMKYHKKGNHRVTLDFQPSSIACLALLACLALCCMCFCVWWVHVIVSSCYKYPMRKGLSPRFSCHFFWTRATLLDLGPDFANLGFIWS